MSKERVTPLSNTNFEKIKVKGKLHNGFECLVGLNTAELLEVLQIAGFKNMSVLLSSSGLEKTAPQFDILTDSDQYILPSQAHWPGLEIKLDVPQMLVSIMDNGESVSEVKAWAREINQILTKLILQAGLQNLVLKHDQGERLYGLAAYASSYILTLVGYDVIRGEDFSVGEFLLFFVILTLSATISLNEINKRGLRKGNISTEERSGEGYRDSFFVFEINRMMHLALRLYRAKLVVPVESNEE